MLSPSYELCSCVPVADVAANSFHTSTLHRLADSDRLKLCITSTYSTLLRSTPYVRPEHGAVSETYDSLHLPDNHGCCEQAMSR